MKDNANFSRCYQYCPPRDHGHAKPTPERPRKLPETDSELTPQAKTALRPLQDTSAASALGEPPTYAQLRGYKAARRPHSVHNQRNIANPMPEGLGPHRKHSAIKGINPHDHEYGHSKTSLWSGLARRPNGVGPLLGWLQSELRWQARKHAEPPKPLLKRTSHYKPSPVSST